MNRFKITVGTTTRDCRVEMNGEVLKGVLSVNFELLPNAETLLTLRVLGEIEVNGHFEEESIVSVKQPIDNLRRKQVPK